MEYSNEEYRDIHFIYGLCNARPAEAAAEYARRFPFRRHPDGRVFVGLHQRLGETGCVAHHPREGRPVTRGRLRVEERILDLVEEDPSTSTRRIAQLVGSDKSTVHRVLQREKLKPFHLTPVQELRPGDSECRMNFCRFIIEQNDLDPHFLFNVCWTDESCFTREGLFNSHNYHYWAVENPHLVRPSNFQYQWQRLNVWGAILGDRVHLRLAPDPLNGANYLEFLNEVLPEVVGDVPGDRFVWFQQDAAPAHSSNPVTRFLNECFPDQWIGRYGVVRWPARSPDLTPLDFFLWGYAKENIYGVQLEDSLHLVARLHGAMANIDGEMLGRVRGEILRRAHLCVAQNGGHFEQLP